MIYPSLEVALGNPTADDVFFCCGRGFCRNLIQSNKRIGNNQASIPRENWNGSVLRIVKKAESNQVFKLLEIASFE